MIHRSHIILFVADQEASRTFYGRVLQLEPELDVPGMTEFRIGADTVLGLMPVAGARRLLGAHVPDLESAAGTSRSELYLQVDAPGEYHARALGSGAREISAVALRSWGHVAAYSLDPDGHVLAFGQAADHAGP